MADNLAGMILAAGLGTRLQPLTHFRAKPAVPFLGRPLIHSSLELIRAAGVEECVVNLHHLPDSVRNALVDAPEPARVHFSYEPRILGTAGALFPLRERFRGRTVILANGKIHFEGNLDQALKQHSARGAWVTLVLTPYRLEMPFNPVWLDPEGRVRSFRSARSADGAPLPPETGLEPFVFTGVHILDPRVLDWIPEGPCDTVADLYPKLMDAGKPVTGFVTGDHWCETSTPARYLEKSLESMALRGIERIDLSETGAEVRCAVIGRQSAVPGGCRVSRSVIWDRVELADGSSVEGSILVDGVRISAPTHIRNSIVTPRLPRLEPLCQASGGSARADHLLWPISSDPFGRLQKERA